MDVSWVISLILGLPVAVLALLKIIDWSKKRQAGDRMAHCEEPSEIDLIIKVEEYLSPEATAGQGLVPIIRQAELAADVEMLGAEELHRYEAAHRC